MPNNFLLSIIIPTKNREKYAVKVVEQILQMHDENIQVVIQDNSDTDNLSSLLNIYKNDIRLKYNYSSGILSFIENFNKAIEMADGEYLCLIGDDDGILPQMIEVVKWAQKNSIDAIKPSLSVVYFWPNSEILKGCKDDGYLVINKISQTIKIIDPYMQVEKLMEQGAQRYLDLSMVKLYHGIVRRNCLNEIKNITGKFIGGLTPDIYISVALSVTINCLVELDFPLTISGICNKSGSADSVTGRHTGLLEEAPHLKGHQNYYWSKLIPRFYSVETIWADSAISALNDLNQQNLVHKFNLLALSSNCLIKYPQFKNIILDNIYKNIGTKNSFKIHLELLAFKNSAINLLTRVIKRLLRKNIDVFKINNINNIIEAEKIAQIWFTQKNININNVIQKLENSNKAHDG